MFDISSSIDVYFSDVDDFIVDEDGQPIARKGKKKKHKIHSDS